MINNHHVFSTPACLSSFPHFPQSTFHPPVLGYPSPVNNPMAKKTPIRGRPPLLFFPPFYQIRHHTPNLHSCPSAHQCRASSLNSINLRQVNRRPPEPHRQLIAIEELSLSRRHGSELLARRIRLGVPERAVLLGLLSIGGERGRFGR